MSHGLIYHYFNSKGEIFSELVARAFDVSWSSFAYAAEAEGELLQKLKIMMETIFAGAFQGEGPYYFLLIIQAFTSDSIPQEVKTLAKKIFPFTMKICYR